MKTLFTNIIIILNIAFLKVNAQNLVPNGSFEENYKTANSFLGSYELKEYVKSWASPTNGTPDYFNAGALAETRTFIPNQYLFNKCPGCLKKNYQTTKSGNAFCGLVFGEKNYKRGEYGNEYLQCKLIKSLTENTLYKVSFFINIGQGYNMFAKDIGVYLSKDSFQYFVTYTELWGNFPFVVPAQILNKNGFIQDTVNWTEISGYYRANGGEEWLTLGHFMQNITNVLKTDTSFGENYYFVDDVSIVEIKGIVAPDTACFGEKSIFYSNANGPFWWGTNSKASKVLSTDSVYEFIADSSRWYYLFSSEGIDSMYLTVLQKPTINLGNDTSFCSGKQIVLSAITNCNSIWFNLTNSPYYTANKEGYYWAVANNGGCKTIDSVFVIENPNPNYLPIHLAEICTADKQEYQLQLTNKNKYLWLYDNDTSYHKTFINEGCNAIKITNEFGCYVTDSFCVMDICKPYIQMPNVFIPDGINNTFKPITKFVEQINWEVYNRYGEKIFSANNLNDEWNGTMNNNPCQSDVYFYIVNYQGILPNNTNQTIKGTFTLIR